MMASKLDKAPKIEKLLKERKIGSISLPKPIQCSKDKMLGDAIRIMQEEKSGYVVVTDQDRVLGIFTEKDFTLNILEKEALLEDSVVKYINASIPVLTLDDSVDQAIDLMYDYEYRHLILVNNLEERKLAGVLSARSIIRFLAEHYPAEVLNLPPRSGQISATREGG